MKELVSIPNFVFVALIIDSAAFVNLSDNDSNIRLALPDDTGKGYYLYTFSDSQNGPELEGPVPAAVRNGKVAVELPAQSFAIVTRL